MALQANAVRATDLTAAHRAFVVDEEPSAYLKAPDHSPVVGLQQKLDRGEAVLKHDAQFGYLRSVLQALGISESSQTLVFSKTSQQRELISPKTPRALFFNDSVYVAGRRR